MKSSSAAWLAIVLFAGAAIPARADLRGDQIQVMGRVLAIDQQAKTIRLQHAATETSGPGIETCRVPDKSLRTLRAGMVIEARASTQRRPWTLSNVRTVKSS